jgi:hypothetical protein
VSRRRARRFAARVQARAAQESASAVVEFDVSCIEITDEGELYGHDELGEDDLCQEDLSHIEAEARSLIGFYFEGLNPTFDCDVPL